MASLEVDQQSRIQRAKAGDPHALETLLLEYSHQLPDYIARRLPASLRSKFSVEDVTQEALTQAFIKIGDLRECSPRAFLAWLKAICDLTLMRLIKAERRQKRGRDFRHVQFVKDSLGGSLIELIDNLPSDGVTASQRVARGEALQAMQVSLAGLPDDQRRAIQLYLLQGETLEATAQAMQRTPAAVRSLIHRGKINLAKAMGRASLWLSRR